MVYLATSTIKINHSCRCTVYTSPMDPMGYSDLMNDFVRGGLFKVQFTTNNIRNLVLYPNQPILLMVDSTG